MAAAASQPGCSETKLEDSMGILEARVSEKVLDGRILVKRLTVLLRSEAVIECQRVPSVTSSGLFTSIHHPTPSALLAVNLMFRRYFSFRSYSVTSRLRLILYRLVLRQNRDFDPRCAAAFRQDN